MRARVFVRPCFFATHARTPHKHTHTHTHTHTHRSHYTHRLICTVTYTTPEGDKLFFRKSFKFLISNPLAVKTKVYNVEVNVCLCERVRVCFVPFCVRVCMG